MRIGYLMQAGAPDIRQQPFSGPATHAKQVIKELERLGHQVCLLAYMDGRIWKSDDLEDYEPVCVRWLDQGPLRLLERGVRRVQWQLALPYAALFESIRFAWACRQVMSDYDLFYERMGWMGYGGSLAAWQLSIPLILEVNGDHLSEMEMLGIAPRGMQKWLSVTLMRKAIGHASYFVASGDGWRQRFLERWRVAPERVTTIENGSELVGLLTREQLRAFRPQENAGEVTRLVYLGGFQPWQGVTILLRAFAQAIAHGASLQLLLIGSGSNIDELERLAVELRIGKFVTFAGRMCASEYAPFLAEADIGVAPYSGWGEFSGLKLLDYKAAGLAIIASGRNGQPKVLSHGHTGWIIPPGDETALSDAILRLGSDTELRRAMGQAARIEAENCHGWNHTAQQLEQVFAQAVER